ncbi:MAG: hypothetical protein RL264_1560 [Bacteroidota bacterium]|jgi:hypothetical protein
MEFLHPEVFWFLPLLLLPVIIHLFHFRKHKTLFFSSLRFIQFIEQENKSAKRLKNLLILLARLLFLLFLIIAFAQPIKRNAGSKIEAGKSVVAIYLDNSFSMTAKGTEGELLSEAQEMARRIVKNAPLGTAFMLTTNKMDGVEQRILSATEVLDALDKVGTSSIRRQLGEVFNWQKNFLQKINDEEMKIGKTNFLVLSDFQKSSSSLKDLQSDDLNAFSLVQFLPQQKGNLTVDSVWFASPLHKRGVQNELFVRVHNYSDENALNTEISMTLEGKTRNVFVDVAAGKSEITNFPFTENSSGFKSGKVSINDRQLYWDDDFFFNYKVAESTGVLILNGKNTNNSPQNAFGVESFYKVKSLPELSFTKDALKEVSLVVLNGLDNVPSGLVADLVEFHEEGGIIFVIPGASINSIDYRKLNTALNLPTFNGEMTEGLKIEKVEYKDPFFQGVFEKETKDLNLPNVKRAFKTTGNSGGNLLTFRNGQSLLLKGETGNFLLTTALQEQFSNFSANALFPVILIRAGEMSVRNQPVYVTIGKENKLKFFDEGNEDQPIRLKGAGMEFIPKTGKSNGFVHVSITGMEAIEKLKAGIFNVLTDKKIGTVALNYDREESTTELSEVASIAEKMKEKGVQNVSVNQVNQGQSLVNLNLDDTVHYWKWALIIALLAFLGEILLIKLLK